MIELDFNFPDLEGRMKRNMRKIYIFIASQMQANRAMLFDAEGAYNGHPKWAPLKFRVGKILQDRGTLRKSIAPTPQAGKPGRDGIVHYQTDKVTIGTMLAYAKQVTYGGKITAKGKALKIPLKGGQGATPLVKALKKQQPPGRKGFMFRKSVILPARRIDEWNNEDQKELDIALNSYLAKLLRGDIG